MTSMPINRSGSQTSGAQSFDKSNLGGNARSLTNEDRSLASRTDPSSAPSTQGGPLQPFQGGRDLTSLTHWPLFSDRWDALMPQNFGSMKMDNNDKQCVITCSLPNVNSENLKIDLNGNFLTVSCHDAKEYRTDYGYSSSATNFSRSITLPPGCNVDAMKADMLNHGELQIVVPKLQTGHQQHQQQRQQQ